MKEVKNENPMRNFLLAAIVFCLGFSFLNSYSAPYLLEPIYYNKTIVADGDDSDWLEIKSKSKPFEVFSADVSGLPKLTGQILMQNNATTLGILLYLQTDIPVKGNEHSIMIVFDENNDGIMAPGENVLTVGTVGDGQTTTLEDAYLSEDNSIIDDPPKYQGEILAKIRHVGEKELLVEVLVPFKNVNDFYDFQMLVEQSFMIGLNYNVVDSKTSADSSFFTAFSYDVAQNPSISINPALQIFTIYCAAILASVVGAAKITKQDARAKFSKKSVSIIVVVLIISALIVTFNPLFETELRSFLVLLSKVVDSFGPEASLYSVLAGLTVGLICFTIFRSSHDLPSNFSVPQKTVLYGCIAIFVISLVNVAATPFLIVLKAAARASLSNNVFEQISSYFDSLLDLVGSLFNVLFSPMFSVVIVWIPTLFLIFVLYETRGKNIKTREKSILILSALAAFVLFSGWFAYSLYFASSFQVNIIAILIGPVVSGVILSFLAAEGYLDTIKENLYRLRTGLSPNNDKSASTIRRFYAGIALIVNFSGLSRYLFLLFIPLGYLEEFEFREFYLITSQLFVDAISWYSISFIGQTKEGAQLIYNSFVALFSLFWLYDIIMILRGFSNEYLHSENRIFSFFKDNAGIFSAVFFLCIMITFMSFQTVIIDSTMRMGEVSTTLPEWVREQTGTVDQGIKPLEKSFLNLLFVMGLATLAGVIYVAKRTAFSKKRDGKMVTGKV